MDFSDPHQLYKQISDNGPVHWNEGQHMWYVLGFKEVRELCRTPKVSAKTTHLMRQNTFPDTARKKAQELINFYSQWILHMDPPEHTSFRRVMQPFFSEAMVDQAKESITTHAKTLLDGIVTPTFNFMEEFAIPLPLMVISDFLGLEFADIQRVHHWLANIAPYMDSTYRDEALVDAAVEALHEEKKYLQKKIAAIIKYEKPCLIYHLYQKLLTLEDFDPDQYWCLVGMLVSAGTETSTILLGNAIYHLLDHPGELLKLRENPQLIESAIDECIRYDSSPHFTIRVALEDIMVNETLIEKGQKICLVFAAGNRDERYFKDPDAFNIEREDNHHIGFGYGLHFCLGRLLGKAVATTTVNQVLNHFPRLSLAGEAVTYTKAINLRCIETLMVTG